MWYFYIVYVRLKIGCLWAHLLIAKALKCFSLNCLKCSLCFFFSAVTPQHNSTAHLLITYMWLSIYGLTFSSHSYKDSDNPLCPLHIYAPISASYLWDQHFHIPPLWEMVLYLLFSAWLISFNMIILVDILLYKPTVHIYLLMVLLFKIKKKTETSPSMLLVIAKDIHFDEAIHKQSFTFTPPDTCVHNIHALIKREVRKTSTVFLEKL